MEFEIVSFRVEHVDRLSAAPLHGAVKLPQLFGGLHRLLEVIPIHIKGLVGYAVLVDGVLVNGPRAFEEDDIIFAALQSVNSRRLSVDRERIWIIGVSSLIGPVVILGVSIQRCQGIAPGP